MRFLAIHAHPDDLEILCGGTLLHLAERGHHITMVTMTAGDCGTAEHSADAITAIRLAEAASAALLVPAEYHCAGFGDLAIFNDDASRRRVTELLRRSQPDVVITAAPIDYHCDHEATSALVRDACFACSVPNYRTGRCNPLPRIPHLYFADPDEGRDREGNVVLPDFVVNVEGHMATKTSMLACHESQREWLRRQHGMDNYITTMQEWTKARGELAGLALGEGFRQYRGHPFPSTPILQESLRGLAVPL